MSPGAIVSARGETMTEPADCSTVTNAAPETSPTVAVTVVTPLPAAVSNPAESTAATVVSLLAHDTATPAITRPL